MQNVVRLIEHFIPEHYQLSLNLERTNRHFSGSVTITGDTAPATENITLHAKDLVINSVILDGKDATFQLNESDELVITHPDIHEGKHIVVISFSGAITDAMHGMYPCFYEHNNEKKELLATQFESHHAREVFPCIDEPEAKATFDVTLTTETGVTVLGNMPVLRQTIDENQLVTTFTTTPRMSTYLLAWAVGDLHRKTATTKSGVEVNIWATPAQKPESLDFALDVATRTIDFFDDYFGTPYPLPKSDHVALPDFSSGAMENWGLITYREVALIADPKTSGISSKQYVALVIAHELSHQWFGNLVTMKWWDNLWLNESFATLMEYIALDYLYPDWNMWLEFSTMESILALRRDSIDGVQSVQTDVHHPDEISTLFDGAIVYAKGARLLRMLQHYIGHEAFQLGLKNYFAHFAYSNTEGYDLWHELSQTSGKDIAHFMNKWITQPGYPVVSAEAADGNLHLRQKQFFIGSHAESSRTWPIPLNGNTTDLPTLLESSEILIPYSSGSPVRLNVGDSAHFITQYSPELLTTLIMSIENQELEPLDRLQLLHEQTLLARSGSISTAALIPLLKAYKDETDEAVWDIISLAIGELRKFTEDNPQSEQLLKNLYSELARAQYERLGWTKRPNESEEDTKLRGTVISMMLYAEDQDAITQALQLFKNSTIEELDSELRQLVLATAVRHGGDASILPALIEAYRQSSSAELKQDIASGITSTQNQDDIKVILQLIKDATTIRPQDVRLWFAWTIRNRFGRQLAWQWLQDNWKWIDTTFAGDKSYDDFPRFAAGALMNQRQLDEYRQFFLPFQDEPALQRVIQLGISEIEARVELLTRDTPLVQAELAKL